MFTAKAPGSLPTITAQVQASDYASIMVSRRNQTLLSLSIFLGVLAWNVAAAAVKGETGGVPVGQLSVHEIEEQLQVSVRRNIELKLIHRPLPFELHTLKVHVNRR